MASNGETIARLLMEAGWHPEQLARRLNECAERYGRPERLHLKTPYKWKKGDVPRSPWPALTAALLSEQLQRTITVEELGWAGPTTGAKRCPPPLVWSCPGHRPEPCKRPRQ